ncbi:hypothetical protein EDC96DRAFT_501897 [Choanephora cucurbitarum]|nr:hypothetical protein EDC96DRAFT_501897 [Choanephora cucurbitarum]
MLTVSQAKMTNPLPSKPRFKEKFVELSESLFEGHPKTDTFWEDYFILPVNRTCLADLIAKCSEETLLNQRSNLNALFLACMDKIESTPTTASETTRQHHAIIILTVLLNALFSKKRLSHFNIIFIMTGYDEADRLFPKLIQALQSLIQQPATRSIALALTLALSAGNDNVNQNGLNSYFMSNDISLTLFSVLKDEVGKKEARDVMMLVGMLSNYNKYEAKNPYLASLKQIKQMHVLMPILQLYTQCFNELQSRYIELYDDEETLTKTFTTYMSRWFSASTPAAPSEADTLQALSHLPSSSQAALLLPLFDLVHGNPYFVRYMMNTPDFLISLLSFTSYLFQNNRTERTQTYTRLMLTILIRLMEEPTVLNYLAQTEASVRLCRQRSPMLPLDKSTKPLIYAALDNLLLMIRHNLRKKLDLATYKMALAVIHRIICFLNKNKIQLNYHWTELWPTLTSTLHFTAVRLDDLSTRDEFNAYLISLIRVFNMCVTHGESFLTDTKSYDSLYYEIIRSAPDFMTLANHVQQTRMRNSISLDEFHNLKLICNHFKPALDEWQVSKNVKFPTPEQVMTIINEHYATLELKPMNKLDFYLPFNEIPGEMGFFRQVLRVVVSDYMGNSQ